MPLSTPLLAPASGSVPRSLESGVSFTASEWDALFSTDPAAQDAQVNGDAGGSQRLSVARLMTQMSRDASQRSLPGSARTKPSRSKSNLSAEEKAKNEIRQLKKDLSALDLEKERLRELVKIRVSREDVIGKYFLPHAALRWIINVIQHPYWPAAIAFTCLLWTVADWGEMFALQVLAVVCANFIFGFYFLTINVWCMLLSLGAFEPIYLLYNTVVAVTALCYTATYATTGRAFVCTGFVLTNILLSTIDATQMSKKARLILTIWLLFYLSSMLGSSCLLYRFQEVDVQYVLPIVNRPYTVNWHTLFQTSLTTLIIFFAKDTFNCIIHNHGETKYLRKVVSFSWYDPGDYPKHEGFDVSPEEEFTKAETLYEQAVWRLQRFKPRPRLTREGFVCGVMRAGMEREPAEEVYKEFAAGANAETEIHFQYTWEEHQDVGLREKLIVDLQQLGAQRYFDVSVTSASGMEMVSCVKGPRLTWHRRLVMDDFPVNVHADVEAGLERNAFLRCWPSLASHRPVLAKLNRAMHEDPQALWAAMVLLSDQATAAVLIQSQFKLCRRRRIRNRARVFWRTMYSGRAPILTIQEASHASVALRRSSRASAEATFSD